jgi:hypothetical protein
LVRLDILPQLRNNDVFSDLVHLNAFGQEIATEAFSSEFRRLSRNP